MKQLLFATLLFVLLSCNNGTEPVSEVKDSTAASIDSAVKDEELIFDQLVGTWYNAPRKTYERWSKTDSGTYMSVVFSVKGKDTSRNETAVIYPDSGKWVFENLVKGQNRSESVKFTSTLFSSNLVQFSNPAHDFPTDVNYTVISSDSVHAFIIGPGKNGGRDTVAYDYKRLKK